MNNRIKGTFFCCFVYLLTESAAWRPTTQGFRDFVTEKKGMEPGYFDLGSRAEILPDIDTEKGP